MSIKFLGDESVGTPFETGEVRTVVVTNEALDKILGFEGETIVYSATVEDNMAVKLPASFLLDLKINGTDLIAGQVLNGAVYDQGNGKLTLSWTIPAGAGNYTVKISWAEQII